MGQKINCCRSSIENVDHGELNDSIVMSERKIRNDFYLCSSREELHKLNIQLIIKLQAYSRRLLANLKVKSMRSKEHTYLDWDCRETISNKVLDID
jgi:hypothetical protein